MRARTPVFPGGHPSRLSGFAAEHLVSANCAKVVLSLRGDAGSEVATPDPLAGSGPRDAFTAGLLKSSARVQRSLTMLGTVRTSAGSGDRFNVIARPTASVNSGTSRPKSTVGGEPKPEPSRNSSHE